MIVIDPVCSHEVETDTTDLKSEYDGKTYYFCEPACKLSFDKNPKKYAVKGEGPK